MNSLENEIVQYIKMRIQKKYEWNILILVILIMLTVAMMWLLTMSFLKQMFAYTINLDWYYKSYYLSKAWIELALTEIDNSDVWFSNAITGTNNLFTQNLCSGLDCSVSMNIRGRADFLSNMFRLGNCATGTAFTLAAWESFALPLFYQQDWLSNAGILLWNWKLNVWYIVSQLGNIKLQSEDQGSLNLSLVFPNLEWQLDNLYIASYNISSSTISDFRDWLVGNWIDLEKIKNEKLYLMISNPNENAVSFCLKSDNIEMPATKFYVVSLWNYQWRYVWMQAIYAQPIPSFMFYGYNEHGSALVQE